MNCPFCTNELRHDKMYFCNTCMTFFNELDLSRLNKPPLIPIPEPKPIQTQQTKILHSKIFTSFNPFSAKK